MGNLCDVIRDKCDIIRDVCVCMSSATCVLLLGVPASVVLIDWKVCPVLLGGGGGGGVSGVNIDLQKLVFLIFRPWLSVSVNFRFSSINLNQSFHVQFNRLEVPGTRNGVKVADRVSVTLYYMCVFEEIRVFF